MELLDYINKKKELGLTKTASYDYIVRNSEYLQKEAGLTSLAGSFVKGLGLKSGGFAQRAAHIGLEGMGRAGTKLNSLAQSAGGLAGKGYSGLSKTFGRSNPNQMRNLGLAGAAGVGLAGTAAAGTAAAGATAYALTRPSYYPPRY